MIISLWGKNFFWFLVRLYYYFCVGRALAISGAVVGGAGLLTNNRELQKVGGSALAGGVGLKTISKLFGK